MPAELTEKYVIDAIKMVLNRDDDDPAVLSPAVSVQHDGHRLLADTLARLALELKRLKETATPTTVPQSKHTYLISYNAIGTHKTKSGSVVSSYNTPLTPAMLTGMLIPYIKESGEYLDATLIVPTSIYKFESA